MFSDKKMKGDKYLGTVECLRGRLLAERQVSRIAKEDSERIENKLMELENKLMQEIKLRNKAEKRLQCLKKKLESLNIVSSDLLQSDQSSSSEKSENCFSSSTTTNTSTTYASEETNEPFNNFTMNSVVTSQASTHYNEDNSSTELIYSSMSNNIDDQLEDYSVDDSRAIVPVSLVESSSSSAAKTKSNNENVAQVLDSLRYIRETIQRSIEMRCMVRVSPT